MWAGLEDIELRHFKFQIEVQEMFYAAAPSYLKINVLRHTVRFQCSVKAVILLSA